MKRACNLLAIDAIVRVKVMSRILYRCGRCPELRYVEGALSSDKGTLELGLTVIPPGTMGDKGTPGLGLTVIPPGTMGDLTVIPPRSLGLRGEASQACEI